MEQECNFLTSFLSILRLRISNLFWWVVISLMSFKLQICRSDITHIDEDSTKILNRFPTLFSDELGRFNKYKVTLKTNVPLKFYEPPPIPLPLKG